MSGDDGGGGDDGVPMLMMTTTTMGSHFLVGLATWMGGSSVVRCSFVEAYTKWPSLPVSMACHLASLPRLRLGAQLRSSDFEAEVTIDRAGS